MTITEKDVHLALQLAKLLDVELEPWQEYVLQFMLMKHREPAPLRKINSTTSLPYIARF